MKATTPSTRTALRPLLAVAALALALTACAGTDAPADDGADGPADSQGLPVNDGDDAPITSGMCAEEEPDCEDTVVDGSSSSCLAGDTECTDESYDGQDVATPVLLTDSSSNAEVIAAGSSSGATGQILTAVYAVDDTTLELTFSGGACDVLEDVLVTESETEVRLLVLAGMDASADACTMQRVEWRTEVTLDAPLGDRTVLDLAG